ncbi:MAG: glutathione peroxidase [Bdellovibrionaceae bacterium]|nr:glutathione peroxidase [Pseudobdellovibrionaceae bacterium]
MSNTHRAENSSKDLQNKEKTFFDFTVKDIHGKDFSLSELKNRVILVVNTASACGFTPQLKDLEELYQKYSSKGFTVLAFPSNDFRQDSGSNEEIEKFAKDKYQISFPIMGKNPVSGKEKQPIFKFLTESKSGFLFREVQWNFEKFLINKKGLVVDRWSSMTSPNSKDIISKIESELLN